MKKIFFVLFCVAAGAVHSNAQAFKFAGSDTHDFGTISAGPEVEYKFEFTNSGTAPLVIIKAEPSCSCTVPDWPKQPILPGKTGVIKVGYKTEGKNEPFNKEVYIQSNATNGQPRYTLHIKGTVKGK